MHLYRYNTTAVITNYNNLFMLGSVMLNIFLPIPTHNIIIIKSNKKLSTRTNSDGV